MPPARQGPQDRTTGPALVAPKERALLLLDIPWAIIEGFQSYRELPSGEKSVTSSARSVNVDSVNQLAEAVRTGGKLNMGKFLRVASDIGGYTPETGPRYKPDGRPGETDDIERFRWVSRWLGLKEPEAEVLFDLGGPRYLPSDITREHLLAVLEAICEGDPVDLDIWIRNDPEWERSKTSR